MGVSMVTTVLVIAICYRRRQVLGSRYSPPPLEIMFMLAIAALVELSVTGCIAVSLLAG